MLSPARAQQFGWATFQVGIAVALVNATDGLFPPTVRYIGGALVALALVTVVLALGRRDESNQPADWSLGVYGITLTGPTFLLAQVVSLVFESGVGP